MKRALIATAASLALLFALAAEAYPKWLGTITSLDGGAFNNTTGGVAFVDGGNAVDGGFALGTGLPLVVQCTNAACVAASADAGFVVTCTSNSTSHGVAIQSGQLYPLPMDGTTNIVAIVPVVAALTSCDIFQLIPTP